MEGQCPETAGVLQDVPCAPGNAYPRPHMGCPCPWICLVHRLSQCNQEGRSQHQVAQPPCMTWDPGPELLQTEGAAPPWQLRRAELPGGAMGPGPALPEWGLPGSSGEHLAICGAVDGIRAPLLGAAVVQTPRQSTDSPPQGQACASASSGRHSREGLV